MSMWAVPGHSADRGSRWKPGKNKASDGPSQPELGASDPPLPLNPSPHDLQQQSQHQQQRQDPDNISEYLEPAIDGPPSPGDIRAFSKQLRNAAIFDKHQSHQTTSSGSSSLRSLASADRRPSWEHTLEAFGLSRKSSGRSTSSSMPSRERPESVQIFGKALFNRRGKPRRETSAGGSSGGSMYSTEHATDAAPPPGSVALKDSSSMPAIFGRRRAGTGERENGQKKFQISEPYNFQHLTHTQRDDLPPHQRTRRMPAPAGMRGIQADDQHCAGFSSEALLLREEEEDVAPHVRVPARNPARFRPPSGILPRNHLPTRRIMKNPRPQDQARIPPPRPPRSPLLEPNGLVPPRVSSRGSMRYDGFDLDRPQTSSLLLNPQPFAMAAEAYSPPATSHSYAAMSPQLDFIPESRYSRIISPPPPDDANWPLPCPANLAQEAPLPQAPKDDENRALGHRPQVSVDNSSLRGSHSVPMFRRFSFGQDSETRRRSSEASDTLGHFETYNVQSVSKAATIKNNWSDSLARESWEDDIDYCYDHAVEADCDYAWERPSCDLVRDCDEEPPVESGIGVSPAMLTTAHFNVPALSPTSQYSPIAGQEVITPIGQGLSHSSNFSLSRNDGPMAKSLLHLDIPNESDAIEHQGFYLSPSLLIPDDFQQQLDTSASDDRLDAHDFSYLAYEEPTLTMDTSMLLVQPRTSASTMTSNTSSRSVFERHISSASAGTDFTRLTMSTTSLDMESYIPKKDGFEVEAVSVDSDFVQTRTESMAAMPPLLEDEAVFETSTQRPFTSRGSEPNLAKWAAEEPHPRKEPIQLRRQRARTTSLSTPPPPGQYGLFPVTKPRLQGV